MLSYKYLKRWVDEGKFDLNKDEIMKISLTHLFLSH
jgi:hypothetical protein